MTPRSGAVTAWEDFPSNTTWIDWQAREVVWTRNSVPGWTIKAASSPRKIPSFTIRALPPTVSSAGSADDPDRRPGAGRGAGRGPSAAPRADAAIRLCPQPCPTSGSASYSARIAMLGPGFPPSAVATKEVGEVGDAPLDPEPVSGQDLRTGAAEARVSSRLSSGSS